MKKSLIIIGICSILLIAGCNSGATDEPNTGPITPVTTTTDERNELRLNNISLITTAMSQYFAKHNEYPAQMDNMCADHLIDIFQKDGDLTADLHKIKAPATPHNENLECPLTGMYYFFRENNPDYYTYGVKMEQRAFGNSDLAPNDIKLESIEELKPVRQSTQNGRWYYIIGNYPLELMQDNRN